jgi:hypothetical protein
MGASIEPLRGSSGVTMPACCGGARAVAGCRRSERFVSARPSMSSRGAQTACVGARPRNCFTARRLRVAPLARSGRRGLRGRGACYSPVFSGDRTVSANATADFVRIESRSSPSCPRSSSEVGRSRLENNSWPKSKLSDSSWHPRVRDPAARQRREWPEQQVRP